MRIALHTIVFLATMASLTLTAYAQDISPECARLSKSPKLAAGSLHCCPTTLGSFSLYPHAILMFLIFGPC
jgi:hypothetical protein